MSAWDDATPSRYPDSRTPTTAGPLDARALLSGSATGNGYPPSSRYAAVPLVTAELPGQGQVVYLGRRLVPPASRFAQIGQRTVEEHQRLDQVAAALMGDPELWWRLCDANDALFPGDLEEPGRVLRVTLPEGIPGAADVR